MWTGTYWPLLVFLILMMASSPDPVTRLEAMVSTRTIPFRFPSRTSKSYFFRTAVLKIVERNNQTAFSILMETKKSQEHLVKFFLHLIFRSQYHSSCQPRIWLRKSFWWLHSYNYCWRRRIYWRNNIDSNSWQYGERAPRFSRESGQYFGEWCSE